MDDQLYREFILEHYKNPQNFGVLEQTDIDLADSNPLCGDEVRMMATVVDDHLTQINFVGRGCAISLASASILTEWLKNRSRKEIQNLSQQDFLDELGLDLTAARLKCALLAFSTLQKALTEFDSAR